MRWGRPALLGVILRKDPRVCRGQWISEATGPCPPLTDTAGPLRAGWRGQGPGLGR